MGLISLVTVLEASIQIWRALLTPITGWVESVIGVAIPNFAIELVIVIFFAVRSYRMITSRSASYDHIVEEMHPTMQPDWHHKTQRLAGVDETTLKAAFMGAPPKTDAEIASKFDRCCYVEEIPQREEPPKRNFSSLADRKSLSTTQIKSFSSLSDRKAVWNEHDQRGSERRTEVHSVSEPLRGIYHSHFRANFINSLLDIAGLEEFLRFPAFRDEGQLITPLMFYDYAYSHQLFETQEQENEADNVLSNVLRFRSELQMQATGKVLSEKHIAQHNANLFLGEFTNEVKDHLAQYLSKDAYPGGGGYAHLVRPIIRAQFLSKILRKEFIRVGRRQRIWYAAISIGTLLIFFLDQVFFGAMP